MTEAARPTIEDIYEFICEQMDRDNDQFRFKGVDLKDGVIELHLESWETEADSFFDLSMVEDGLRIVMQGHFRDNVSAWEDSGDVEEDAEEMARDAIGFATGLMEEADDEQRETED